jgi:putative heme-binding domain-containing protein
MSNLSRLAVLLLATALVRAPLRAAEEKVFTQKPTVAPSRVHGSDAAPATPVTQPPEKRLTRGPAPYWIWGADIDRRYFLRKEFTGGSTSARLRATCDNRMTVFINGEQVAESSEWERPVEVDVQKFIRPGKNVLLAEVVNEGGPAGFLLKLALTSKGKTRYVVSDDTWQAAEKKDADRWVAARKIAKMGEGPWGGVFFEGAGTSATAAAAFNVLPGFQVEHLFTVPKPTLGSWVSLTVDDKGRLIVSDQDSKGLCRVTPPRIGTDEETKVERLDTKITAAQGLLYAFGSLYVSVNGGPGSGLYRLRSTKGDDHFDEVKKLKAIHGGGEHGPHALRLSPDGKSIYLVSGNHTLPPFDVKRNREPLTMGGVGKVQLRVTLPEWASSRLMPNWDEDLLLPRQWDAGGHARGILAPGGWIARTDPDGKTWELVSAGYRNSYDIALNADGELFTYDSDMEWDMGMPWYRPTRVCHATSGSEFGWRSGTGVWPAYYPDSLPPALDVGPGSPVGMEFGYGTRFPAKYQKALFCCDWTFGTIYALHLEPDGASYKATKEEFLSRTPLPLTDIAAGPDGALYFVVGGRGTQSDLFRVTYVGKEPTDPVDYHDPRHADLRTFRREIERYQTTTGDPAKAVEFVYPYLGHADRFIRFAALVALEHQKPALWQDRVLAETDPERFLTGAVALARQGDKSIQPRLLSTLDRLDLGALPEPQQLGLLRVYQLAFIRLGEPDKDTAARIAKRLDAHYPAKTDPLNRELSTLLVYLKSPAVVPKTVAMMRQPSKQTNAEHMEELLARNQGYGGVIAKMLANAPDLQKLHYAFVLRNLKEGWTMDERKFYFKWLNEARQKSGGASYQGFLNNIEKEAFDNATDTERLAIEAAGLRKPFKPKELPKPKGPGRDWKLDELVQFAEPRLKGRDFKNGEKMYAATRCIVCHRFSAEGGATGPDLTEAAGRFSLKDLCESIVEPSKVISDQYKASTVTTSSGKVYTGRIVTETKDVLTILTDPEDSTKVIEVKKSDVDETVPSPVSLMPAGLLNPLNDDEVLDLLAYILSRGDPKHPMFRR